MEAEPRFREGLEAFNRGDFYEAHDAWESLWLERFGEEKNFLQGLILCAVALHHYGRGNLRGARSRYRLAEGMLEPYPDAYWGVDLKRFRRRMKGVMHRVLTEAEPPALDAAKVPKLRAPG
jgi:predicted metal-dependent hydrolase